MPYSDNDEAHGDSTTTAASTSTLALAVEMTEMEPFRDEIIGDDNDDDHEEYEHPYNYNNNVLQTLQSDKRARRSPFCFRLLVLKGY
ncbi:hypothetical protein IV203_019250 [Nitzschia inconspicua]|uniref:Uncharacterized protein n=1 Tax=Nitzschia inconspicua TaxID=303405 RepID=A0A9K3LZG0_9STRA|nr:hypothetical protein IV203_019250 [Nitzschia inconspicua]